mmetsp:Transcript_76949/g.213838  ORF Transcript_76949/g.213838 Transcript_76949/m.213838 type:complete len:406 (-) Transcript_76949:209-1426(-)|eukprot:CAMPEP_0117466352 /NCGR_PEP_ID=MMETSP0784-20121206/5099_1 /TAXON_ID=39447 /ORGANISM="" /LENGTH=405 /DNA_ID=CAMNT_0005260293 /DNA_START=69 /DNA_END=1286 /DNA_ORIENTATION=-
MPGVTIVGCTEPGCPEAHDTGDSPASLKPDSSQGSLAASTATPSEEASAHGGLSPRANDDASSYNADARWKSDSISGGQSENVATRSAPAVLTADIADELVAELFADSDDEPSPASPSKSARRRARRRRQREALKAAVDEGIREKIGTLGAVRSIVEPCAQSRSIVTLGDIGFNLNAEGAEATSTAQLASHLSPVRGGTCALVRDRSGLTSTRPCRLASIAAGSVDTCTQILPTTTSLSDASTRPLPPRTPPRHVFHHLHSAPFVGDASSHINWCVQSPNATTPTRATSMNSGAVMTPVAVSGYAGFPCSPCAAASTQVGRPAATWNFMNSPASPCAGVAAQAPPPVVVPEFAGSMPCSPFGNASWALTGPTADTLRILLGSGTSSSWGDIGEKLQAAAPEFYED